MSDAAPSGDSRPARLRILCIVPFLNEAPYLPRFLQSLAEQRRCVDLFVLVDDGSSDDSAALAHEFAAAHENVMVLQRPPRPPSRDRLAEVGELRAFQWALGEVDSSWDLVAKLDADLQLTPDFFGALESAFLEDSRLGVAGAYLSTIDSDTGAIVRERCEPQHVRGASKFYRRACFEQIAPVPACLGWDTIDEIAARACGWQTQSISCASGDPIHLRPLGSVDGRLRAQYRWGMCAFGIGQHPLWVLLSAVRRLSDAPPVLGSAAFVAGWAMARLRGHRCAPARIRAHGRREQLARLRGGFATLLRP
jgi:poly-beta-1,6-N-acetyl-D-glucosamine synthase